ncbi:ecdysis triggering hormone [Osmia lignaria lignaria]|uniref:ecdysis triggering hormone n=1 Tax=Osmia lignaria lignaria TaxID=1437193 RepID=UPI00147807AE|nr:uncharacterized protein LOC117603197 [Osmia lignaria]
MMVSRSSGSKGRFVVGAFLFATLVVLIGPSKADEVPAFFLKIAKNIPRVGRSDGYDDFYKSRQNIPQVSGHDSVQPESWYPNNEPFARPIKRRADYPHLEDSWSWQHFPLAIEGPRELWRTLAGYSKDSSDDIDNEIWERKKRTGNEAMALPEN